jgi:beta-lactamase class A
VQPWAAPAAATATTAPATRRSRLFVLRVSRTSSGLPQGADDSIRALALLPCTPREPPAPPPPLAGAVRAILQGFPGQVRLFAKNLDTGATFGLGEDDRVRAASTIKLAVMVEAFDRVARGRARWDEPLTPAS